MILVITEILVRSFVTRHGVSAVLQEDYIVHLEVVYPSSLRMTPCKRESSKGERRNLTCQVLTFLPPESAPSLVHFEGNVAEFYLEISSRPGN